MPVDSLQFTAHTIPMALSALVAAIGAFVAWQRRRGKLEIWGIITQLGVLSWALTILLIITVTPETWKLAGVVVFYPVVIVANFSFLVFTVHFVGREEWVTPGRLALLFFYPLVFLVAGLTNDIHNAMYLVDGVSTDGFAMLEYSYGRLFYALILPGYSANVAYIVLLYQHFRRSRNVYRTMSFVLFVCMTLLTVVSFPSLLQVSPLPHYMLFPYTYLVLGGILVLGTSSVSFLRRLPVERIFAVFNPQYRGETVPTARDFIMEEIDNGLVVLDTDDIIVDINTTAKKMLDADRPIGKPFQQVVNTDLILSDTVTKEILEEGEIREFTDEVWVDTPRGDRCYDVRFSALTDGGQTAGHVVLLHDITAQKNREEQLRERERELQQQKEDLETQKTQLEHQNERLDKFASIVSHDLRNPLNVARGRTQYVEEGLARLDDPPVDIEHPRQVSDSLQRMEAIIDDALTLAREGKAITETEQVLLSETVQQAWENVDTKQATLTNCDPVRIESDENRLLNVFENLFRNAIEHGREDVTVRVGLLADGFYVEDDGPGIPDEQKDEVLEEGFTTAREGTGFGLAIVRDVIRAHGWEVTVTDSPEGGARLEITGVAFTWTTQQLVDQLAETLGEEKAEQLVAGAMAEADIDSHQLTKETAITVLETIPDLDESNPMATAAAESALSELHPQKPTL